LTACCLSFVVLPLLQKIDKWEDESSLEQKPKWWLTLITEIGLLRNPKSKLYHIQWVTTLHVKWTFCRTVHLKCVNTSNSSFWSTGKRWSYHCNKPWRLRCYLIFLYNRLTDGGDVFVLYSRQSFPPLGRFLILLSVRGGVDHRATVWLEWIVQLKIPITLSGSESVTFCLLVKRLIQLRYSLFPGFQHNASTNYATACPLAFSTVHHLKHLKDLTDMNILFTKINCQQTWWNKILTYLTEHSLTVN
jgi:hypothetical protein